MSSFCGILFYVITAVQMSLEGKTSSRARACMHVCVCALLSFQSHKLHLLKPPCSLCMTHARAHTILLLYEVFGLTCLSASSLFYRNNNCVSLPFISACALVLKKRKVQKSQSFESASIQVCTQIYCIILCAWRLICSLIAPADRERSRLHLVSPFHRSQFPPHLAGEAH